METLNTDKGTLKKFCLTMAVIFFAFSAVFYLKHKNAVVATGVLAGIFLCLSFVPLASKPLYIAWMKLAQVLGWINTRIILCVLYYFVLTPMGIIMRFLGKDPLERRIEKNRDTYWKKKPGILFDQSDYRRQF